MFHSWCSRLQHCRDHTAHSSDWDIKIKMAGRLAGKLCVVTGAAHGIGKATAQIFASEGARLVLADRDERAGERVAELLRARGADIDVTFVACDVSDESAVDHMIKVASDIGGGKV